METVKTKNFHTIKKLKSEKQEVYILKTWKPKKDVLIIGAQMGLLCQRNEHFEIYLAISKTPRITPKKFFVGLKKEFMFYAQRDVYGHSTGMDELTKEVFLPEGHGFHIKKGEPVYIKAGAVNATEKDLYYDAFCNIYYTDVKGR